MNLARVVLVGASRHLEAQVRRAFGARSERTERDGRRVRTSATASSILLPLMPLHQHVSPSFWRSSIAMAAVPAAAAPVAKRGAVR